MATPTPQQVLDIYKGVIQRGLDEFVSQGIRDAIANGLQYVFENAGAAGIANDHIFNGVAMRDSYFNPDRLTELQPGTPIIVQTGSSTSPSVILQVWGGAASPPTYDANSWLENGDISLLRFLNFDAAAQGGLGELQSSVPFYASVLRSNTGTLQLDNAVDIESNTDSICIVDNARVERHEPVNSQFTLTTAGQNPVYNQRGTPDTLDVSMLMDGVFSSGNFNYTTTTDSNSFALIVRPLAAGDATLTVFFGTSPLGVRLVSEFMHTFEAGDVNSETEVALPNCVRTKPGESLCIKYTGPNLAGHQYASDPNFGDQLVPFFRVRRHPITVVQMATQPYVDNAVVGSSRAFNIINRTTATYTIDTTDRNTHTRYTGTSDATWTLPSASTLANGWGFYVSTDTNQVTINRAGSDTIDGGTSVVLAPGDTFLIARSSSSAFLTSRIDGNAIRIQGIPVSTTAPTNGQILKYNGTQYAPAADTGGDATVNYGVSVQNTGYTIQSTDRGQYIRYNQGANGIYTMPLANSLTDGFGVFISTDSHQVTVGRTGTDTIDATTGVIVPPRSTYLVARASATTYVSYVIDGNAVAIRGVEVSSTAPSNGQILKYNGTSQQYEPATDQSGMDAVNYSVLSDAAARSISATDRGQYLRYIGASQGTWTLPSGSAVTDGYGVFISTNASTLVVAAASANTVDGQASITIPIRSTYLLARSSATNFNSYVIDGNALAIQGTPIATTTPSNGQVLKYNGTSQQYEPADESGNVNPVLSLHNFSINIPARVDVGTNLGTRTITYSITNYSLLTALQLQIGGTNFAAITAPTSDGEHTAQVNLSSVDTSSATTLVFRLQANGSINSNTQSVSVANLPAQEMLYWGPEADNVASTFDFAAAQSQEAMTGNIIVPTYTGNQYLKIAYPATEPPVTSLTIGGLNQLGAFTLNEDALTIGGELYDVLVSNNALDGAIISGTTITITR